MHQFIEDLSTNRKFDPKFQAKLKPIFHKTVEFYISIELPKKESNRWPIKFYLKFQNEDFFTPLGDLWKKGDLFREKFLSILLKKKKFLNLLLDSMKLATKVFPPLNRTLKNKYPQNIEMTYFEVSEFLNRPIEILQYVGFKVQYPPKLRLTQGKGLSYRQNHLTVILILVWNL